MSKGLILAAGLDPGFQMDIPKQFVIVDNRPIIVYTLQAFQRHPEIDEIVVSCLPGWQEMVRAYAKQFNITKLSAIVEGGPDGQESSRRGVEWLAEHGGPDDVIVIHDAIRPLVTEDLITDSICTCRKKGMGVAAVRSVDTIMLSDDGISGKESIVKQKVRRIQTPQSYRLGYLKQMHEEALQKGVLYCMDNNSMIARLGQTVYFSKGSDFNIKINAVEDVEMFKALYHMK